MKEANPFSPSVKLMLDCERELTYPLPAIFAIEDATGLDILGGGLTSDDLMGKTPRERMERVITMCWAGLISKHPELTRDQVAKWIYIGNMPMVEAKIMEAFFSSLPSPSEEKEESPLAEPAPAES